MGEKMLVSPDQVDEVYRDFLKKMEKLGGFDLFKLSVLLDDAEVMKKRVASLMDISIEEKDEDEFWKMFRRLLIIQAVFKGFVRGLGDAAQIERMVRDKPEAFERKIRELSFLYVPWMGFKTRWERRRIARDLKTNIKFQLFLEKNLPA